MKMDTSISRLNPQLVDNRKYYQTWRGMSSFCCKGKVYIAPGYIFGLLTLSFILIYSLIFSVFVANKLEGSRWLLISLEIIASALTCLFCLICTFSDPGLLPVQLYTPSQLKNVIVNDHHRTMFIKGVKFKIKFCKTCQIVRPPGVFHCKKCGGCIDRFDHHCPWVGNCIGKNNYRYFFSFLVFFNILLYYNLFASICYLVIKEKSLPDGSTKVLDTEYMALVAVILSIITCCFVTTLLIYHLYFCGRNMTSYANIKMAEIYQMFGNPFSRKNFKKNCYEVLCRKYYKKIKFQDICKLEVNTNNNFIISRIIFKNKELSSNTAFLSLPIGKNIHDRHLNLNHLENLKEDPSKEIIGYDRQAIAKYSNEPEDNEKFKILTIMPKHKGKSLYSLETEETSKVDKKMKKIKLKLKKVFVSE